MRMPTIKSLSAIPDADHARMRAILKMNRRELSAIPECAARIAECYSAPCTWDLRMIALNSAARSHGVEFAQVSETLGMRESDYAAYLNVGDSYVPTVIYWQGRYRVQSVGDFIETLERRGVHFR